MSSRQPWPQSILCRGLRTQKTRESHQEVEGTGGGPCLHSSSGPHNASVGPGASLAAPRRSLSYRRWKFLKVQQGQGARSTAQHPENGDTRGTLSGGCLWLGGAGRARACPAMAHPRFLRPQSYTAGPPAPCELECTSLQGNSLFIKGPGGSRAHLHFATR